MSYLLIITQIFLQSFQLVITVNISEDEEYLLYEDGDILDNDGIEIDDLKVGQIFSCEDVAVKSIENSTCRMMVAGRSEHVLWSIEVM